MIKYSHGGIRQGERRHLWSGEEENEVEACLGQEAGAEAELEVAVQNQKQGLSLLTQRDLVKKDKNQKARGLKARKGRGMQNGKVFGRRSMNFPSCFSFM